jgi:hypothetical protein
MSHGATTAFQAPVVDSGAALWEAFHHEMQPMTDGDHFAKATFSGGCFWCLQPPFDTLGCGVHRYTTVAAVDVRSSRLCYVAVEEHHV